MEPEEVEGHQPRVVALDEFNRVVERLDYAPIELEVG